MTSDPLDGDDPAGALIAEAMAAYEDATRAGAALDVEAFCARYPSIAGSLRKVLQIEAALSRLAQRPEPPEAPAVPATLGPYTILEPSGRGGMASVFRALDPRLGREVALKVLTPDREPRAGRRERFLREARALARIDHPNVVPIHDVGEDPPFCYLAMELMDGSLADRLDRAGAPPAAAHLREVARWILDAARGLGRAHAEGILHRDVKPHNLLVGRDGRVRVGDFGLARLEGDDTLTASRQVVGTLRYAAPEQIRGEEATPAADVYGLGATLYHLATGAPPPAVIDRGRAPLVGIGHPLAAVVARATAPIPADRYPDMASFAADLEAFLDGRRPRAMGPDRRRWAIAGALLAAAAIAAGGAATARRPAAAPPPARAAQPGAGGGYLVWMGTRDQYERSDDPNPSMFRARRAWADLVGDAAGADAASVEIGGRVYRVALEDAGAGRRLTLRRAGASAPLATFTLSAPDLPPLESFHLRVPLVDVDGDGVPDVVLGADSAAGSQVAVVKWDLGAFGDPALGWQTAVEHRFNLASVTVDDWDGDGRREVLVGDDGTDIHTGAYDGHALLHEVDLATGVRRRAWPIEGLVNSTPQLLRAPSGRVVEMYLDADAAPWSRYSSLYRFVSPGSAPPTRRALLGPSLSWPVFQDVDGDGEAELVVGDGEGTIHCFRRDAPGTELWSHHAGKLLSYLLPTQQDADALPELCFSVVGRFSCIKTAPALAPSDRVVFHADLPDGDYAVNRPTDVGDLDGDGFSEIAIASFPSPRVYVLTKNDPSHVFLVADVPREALPAATNTEWSPRGFFWARVAVVPDLPGGGVGLVAALSYGWVLGWRVAGRRADLAWSLRTPGSLSASPQVVRLPGDGPPRHGILVASNISWIHLLAPSWEGGRAPEVVWSHLARGGVRGTPAVVEEGGTRWIVYADWGGTVSKVPLRLP